MSIALATKGMIAGIGTGTGSGGGGLYPDGYTASAIQVAVDLSNSEITVVMNDPLGVSVSMSDAIDVSVDVGELTVDVAVNEPEVEVDV